MRRTLFFSTKSDGSVVKYSYLADGRKVSSLTGDGIGLVYRGPFVYRRDASGTLTFESASCEGGRLEPDAAYRYVTDHLGSTRAVARMDTYAVGDIVDYSSYGERTQVSGVSKTRLYFTGKEDQSVDFGLPYVDFGARHYSAALHRWLVPDPLAQDTPTVSAYAYCANNPINLVDPDGRDGIYINFPEYKIKVLGKEQKHLGHSGVLLIDNKSGLTKYYEYGRYDDANFGIVRNLRVPDVIIGNDGKPTNESLEKVLKSISQKAGHDGPIEGAYVQSDDFTSMNEYAKELMKQNSNPKREKYNPVNNNCSTFAEDVLKQDKTVREKAPRPWVNRPNGVIKLWQKRFERISYKHE